MLTFNSSPEYAGNNIGYDSLKEAIYRLEKQSVSYTEPSAAGDLESANLLASSSSDPQDPAPVRIFSALLDQELEKITKFHTSEQARLMQEFDNVKKDMTAVEESDWRAMEQESAANDDSDDEGGAQDSNVGTIKKLARRLSGQPSQSDLHQLHRASSQDLPTIRRPRATSASSQGSNSQRNARDSSAALSGGEDTVWWSHSDWAVDTRITFKLRLQALYRELSQLKEYIQLNMTGFRKICKKYVCCWLLTQSCQMIFRILTLLTSWQV